MKQKKQSGVPYQAMLWFGAKRLNVKTIDEKEFLNTFIDKYGKIAIESKNFKRELLEIFYGSEIGKKLEKGIFLQLA